jgi:membrane-anchored protein YejM (alkaline phosphatase superfamily)
MIVETFLNVSVIELHKFADLRDYLFLLIPIGLFWLVLFSPPALRIWMVRISFAWILFLSSISIHAANHKTNPIPAEIRLNPALFLLSDVAENMLFRHTPEGRIVKMVLEDESGIQPTGWAYKNQMKPIKFLPPENTHPWNMVFFIMESVGTRYMFDTSYGNPMPMPFLHQISQRGWYFKKHYTPSNISTKAIFSLLSGLYDFFNRETFGIRSDASVPSLFHFLNKRYDSFFVTPSPITWYFPTAFAKNSGLTEMHHFENLNFRVKEEFHSLGRYIGRDEVQTVDFFIERMNKAKEPFVGIYLSFTAHLPYFDYGPDYRIMEDDGRSISRYYNNLNLLDHMIKRIYDNLEKQGLLERTIFVIVGDHGQAFGQHHPDNYMHYRYSYNENLETPVILYQPALFKPRTFEFPTSHVDLLPTLLDAMRIPYDPALFDGESLFHNRLKRRYIFFYGYEGSISSLDNHQIKLQYSFKKDRCWVFDLNRDPGEKNPLDCGSYQLQLEALQNFVSYHDSSLLKYNACIQEKRDFQGHRHPSF